MQKFIFILFALVFQATLCFAQPGLPDAPAQAPIDGGLGFAAAAGGLWAYRKLKRLKR